MGLPYYISIFLDVTEECYRGMEVSDMAESTATKSNRPYKVDDYVVYRRSGICRIADIRRENFSSVGEREYYVMKPLHDDRSKFYVPADIDDDDNCMRKVLSTEEIKSAISQAESFDGVWDDNSDIRSANFAKLLAGGNSAEVLWLFKSLSLYKKKLKDENRKFYDSDNKMLNAAEKIITEEFAFVLGIGRDEVIPYIMQRLTAHDAAKDMVF